MDSVFWILHFPWAVHFWTSLGLLHLVWDIEINSKPSHQAGLDMRDDQPPPGVGAWELIKIHSPEDHLQLLSLHLPTDNKWLVDFVFLTSGNQRIGKREIQWFVNEEQQQETSWFIVFRRDGISKILKHHTFEFLHPSLSNSIPRINQFLPVDLHYLSLFMYYLGTGWSMKWIEGIKHQRPTKTRPKTSLSL